MYTRRCCPPTGSVELVPRQRSPEHRARVFVGAMWERRSLLLVERHPLLDGPQFTQWITRSVSAAISSSPWPVIVARGRSRPLYFGDTAVTSQRWRPGGLVDEGRWSHSETRLPAAILGSPSRDEAQSAKRLDDGNQRVVEIACCLETAGRTKTTLEAKTQRLSWDVGEAFGGFGFVFPGFQFVATQGGRPPEGAVERVHVANVRRRRAALRRWAGGEPTAAICAEYGCSRASLFRWRARHEADGLAGIIDRPRIGRASELPPVIERLVLTVRLLTYWNSRQIAAEFCRRGVWPLSHGQVTRLGPAHSDERTHRADRQRLIWRKCPTNPPTPA